MLKSLPKIIIIFSILITPILLGASFANAATYTCKQSDGTCFGTYDTADPTLSGLSAVEFKKYCDAKCGFDENDVSRCVLYNSSTVCTNATALETSCNGPDDTNCASGLECKLVESTSTIGGSAPKTYKCLPKLYTTTPTPADTAPTQEKSGFKPQVQIPGLEKEFTANKAGEYVLPNDTGAIAKYIRAIYKYAIGIVGILAAVVLMIGGVIWIVAGGNATAIGEAKAWIGASLTGLLLALMSYLILATVNPALVELKTTGVNNVAPAIGNGNGENCCLGGDNTVTYFFNCKNVSKSDECKTLLFPTDIKRIKFVEGKNCKKLGGIAWGC